MAARTALVVEDDKGIQSLLKDALEDEGFQVQCEKDGEWARRALERRLPDLLVTDVLLPGLGGFELLEALRRMPGGEHVPVICISGIYRGARHHKNAERRLGVAHYFDKPFDVAALLASARQLLGEDHPGKALARRRGSKDLERASSRGDAKGDPKHDAAAERHDAKGDGRQDVGDDPLADFDTRLEKAFVEKSEDSFTGPRVARGNLKHKRFPEVLSQLYRWRSTGALLLRRGRVKKIVYLKEGYPIFVKSNLLSECLGRVLVRERMISEEECERSLLAMKEHGGRQQGTVLIEMGCISPHNLVFALQLQLEQKLFDIFGWPDGDYQFSPNIPIPAQAVHLDMSLSTIVYEGVRRRFTEAQLDDVLAPFLDAWLGVHPDPLHRFQEISLEADERKLVALIDGRRTMREVLSRGGLAPLHARQLVYALLSSEMIQPHTKAAKKKDALDGVGNATPPPLPLPHQTKKKVDADALAPSQLVNEGGADELRQRLVERARAMKRQSHFEMLGVSRHAGPDEVQRAYFALVREVHPDRLRQSAPADARALAEQIHAQLVQAYEVLSDDKRRADYLERLDRGAKAGVSDELSKILAAEARFKKGEQAAGQQAWDKASALFAEAIALYPDEGEFHAHLGWAVFSDSGSNLDAATRQAQALQRIDDGIRLNPRLDKAYLWKGQVLRAMGKGDEASRAFERAIQCNPDCTEALVELKLLSSARRHKGEAARGG